MNRLESNHLAIDIFEQGGIWKTRNANRDVLVRVYGMSVLRNGMIVLKVVALEGKPFMQKNDYGDGRVFKSRTEYALRFPCNLSPIEKTE